MKGELPPLLFLLFFFVFVFVFYLHHEAINLLFSDHDTLLLGEVFVPARQLRELSLRPGVVADDLDDHRAFLITSPYANGIVGCAAMGKHGFGLLCNPELSVLNIAAEIRLARAVQAKICAKDVAHLARIAKN